MPHPGVVQVKGPSPPRVGVQTLGGARLSVIFLIKKRGIRFDSRFSATSAIAMTIYLPSRCRLKRKGSVPSTKVLACSESPRSSPEMFVKRTNMAGLLLYVLKIQL